MLVFLLLPLLRGGDTPAVHRAAAMELARQGDWRAAEERQREAMAACASCDAETRMGLRAELAAYLVLGGFPEAAAPLWRQSLAELAADSPSRTTALLGLGVALHAAGRTADAAKAWEEACLRAEEDRERAACQFNIAVAKMEREPVWSELEELLPVLLTAPGPMSRATALLQTARAAAWAGRRNRAMELLARAEAVVRDELSARHPFLADIFHARAEASEEKEAKAWRKRAARAASGRGWERGTVSAAELKKKPR